MGEAAMSLGDQDLERIGEYVRTQLPAWIAQVPSLRTVGETVLLERMVRVEEAILNTQQLMRAEFKAVDKRFDAVDRRFEAVDKRFEDLVHVMDTRFEAVDRRFDDLIHTMDKRFEAVDKRFEASDLRFADMQQNSNDRFTQMQQSFDDRFAQMQQSLNDRFADMQQSFKRTQWFIGAATLLLTTVMSLYRFVG